ncbi:hypothetical protein L2E82_18694 [Cichorium intybus]|uniref:Uncharacterized protein n=1 Tax=Cichorium intybus TaxID=13427 RepID=A0ACB9FA16_CICIN|nr:hypothetical protein L2E82_18694 [Cichorium intybus]
MDILPVVAFDFKDIRKGGKSAIDFHSDSDIDECTSASGQLGSKSLNHFLEQLYEKSLAVITFVGGNELEVTEKSMQSMWHFMHSRPDFKEAQSVAIFSWSLLLSTMDSWTLSYKHWRGNWHLIFLRNYIFLTVGRVGSGTDLIVQRVEFVQEVDKRSHLMELLHAQKENDSNTKALTLFLLRQKKEPIHLNIASIAMASPPPQL